MTHALIVFRARSQATKFYERIKNYDYTARLVSTPASVYPECSLSVKVSFDALVNARAILNGERFNTHIGVFVSADGWKTARKVRI